MEINDYHGEELKIGDVCVVVSNKKTSYQSEAWETFGSDHSLLNSFYNYFDPLEVVIVERLHCDLISAGCSGETKTQVAASRHLVKVGEL